MNGNLSPDYSSSSASSSPRPPLPDAVLRSLRFPERQRDGTSNGNGTEAHTQGAGERVRHPVSADDHGAGTIADAAIPAQDRVDMDWSGFSDHDLDLVIANLEARASERRNKVRKIEALSEELGLNIHQQDWAALVRRPASVSGPSMAGSRDNFGQDEIQHQVDAPEDAEPMSVSETQPIHELTIADNDSANSSPDVQAEPEAPRRSLRIGHGLKRGHDQMEHQRSDSANSRDDGEVEEVAGEHETGGQSDSSMNAVPRRTAWSVVLETYPEEIAKWFKPGKRPTNERVRSLLDLPAVNALVVNKKGRRGPWNLNGGASRQTDHLIAVLVLERVGDVDWVLYKAGLCKTRAEALGQKGLRQLYAPWRIWQLSMEARAITAVD